MNTFNTNPEKYDLVVLGSGAGGKLIAWTSAQKGQRVVVVERKYVGGSCPNIACLPSKNIIHSAKVASFFYRSDEFGISKENVHINMAAVRERKREMVRNLGDIHLDHYKKSGAELVMGTGRFVGPKTVEVELADGGTRTESAIRELCSSIRALATSKACLASTWSMASRSGDRVREREMTGAKSILQLKVMLTAFFRSASQRSHLRLSVRQQFDLAIMPTAVVLLMVGWVHALSDQRLIFTSLASSAFLVYLDPEHPTNRVRTFLIAQGSATLLGFGSVSLLGSGFLAAGVATVLTILIIITLDAMHPPAISTALSCAFHTNSKKAAFADGSQVGFVLRQGPRPNTHCGPRL